MVTFTEYVRQTTAGDDPRGDFVRDARNAISSGKLREPRSLDGLISSMRTQGACPEAIAQAHVVWSQFIRMQRRRA